MDMKQNYVTVITCIGANFVQVSPAFAKATRLKSRRRGGGGGGVRYSPVSLRSPTTTGVDATTPTDVEVPPHDEDQLCRCRPSTTTADSWSTTSVAERALGVGVVGVVAALFIVLGPLTTTATLSPSFVRRTTPPTSTLAGVA